MVGVGDEAPDFELMGSDGGEPQWYSLSDQLDDGPVVLAFYPLDFSPVCTEELCTLHEGDYFEFVPEVDLFGLSTDGVYSHKEFANKHGFGFPLLSDADGEVADAYGVRRDDTLEYQGQELTRVTQRSLFIVDTDRTVQYAWAAEQTSELPDLLEAKERLDEIEDGTAPA